jgi:hypothetical protein
MYIFAHVVALVYLYFLHLSISQVLSSKLFLSTFSAYSKQRYAIRRQTHTPRHIQGRRLSHWLLCCRLDVYTSSYATPAKSGIISCLHCWRPIPAVSNLVSSHPSVTRRPVRTPCEAAFATMVGVKMASLPRPSSRLFGCASQTGLRLGSSSYGVSKTEGQSGVRHSLVKHVRYKERKIWTFSKEAPKCTD